MIQGSCDPFCCCDETDCPKSFVEQWVSDRQCRNETYDETVKILSPLPKCFESDLNEYNFNKKQGLQTYYSPFTNLFCVSFDNAPQMGRFYSANSTAATSADLNRIENEYKNSIRKNAFTASSTSRGDRLYQIGDKMKSRV